MTTQEKKKAFFIDSINRKVSEIEMPTTKELLVYLDTNEWKYLKPYRDERFILITNNFGLAFKEQVIFNGFISKNYLFPDTQGNAIIISSNNNDLKAITEENWIEPGISIEELEYEISFLNKEMSVLDYYSNLVNGVDSNNETLREFSDIYYDLTPYKERKKESLIEFTHLSYKGKDEEVSINLIGRIYAPYPIDIIFIQLIIKEKVLQSKITSLPDPGGKFLGLCEKFIIIAEPLKEEFKKYPKHRFGKEERDPNISRLTYLFRDDKD